MGNKKHNKLNRGIKIVLIILAVIVAIILAYVIYFFACYHRIPDNQVLDVNQASVSANAGTVTTGETYRIMSYNIGFGAYVPEFSFFMDGGTESWAFSKEKCEYAVNGAANTLKEQDPDFVFIQEVDIDSTRSYHLDQRKLVTAVLDSYNWTFAQNYDSPFMMYPFYHPHGICRAGLMTMSKYTISDSIRRSFPITTSFKKVIDLDRCYSITSFDVDNGKKLYIINLHMTAYGGDDSVREAQTSKLFADMEKYYANGDYVIVGGDFNHDLLLGENETGFAGWAQPFPKSKIPEGFRFAFEYLSEEELAAMPLSSRNTDMPYQKGVTLENLLDGFIISDNITMETYTVLNKGYLYADHEPVMMDFILN